MNNPIDTCVCGDSFDDHGHDPDYPGSTACQCDECDCLAYEKDYDEDDEDSDDSWFRGS